MWPLFGLLCLGLLGSAACSDLRIDPLPIVQGGQSYSADGFRFVGSGPCAINQARLHKYASSLSASANIMGVGGERGLAIAECITSACDSIPRIEYAWRPPPPMDALTASVDGTKPTVSSAEVQGTIMPGIFRAYPQCERGAWTPVTAGVVKVAVFQNFAAFGGSGCVELHRMDDNGWTPIASLPETLTLIVPKGKDRAGGTLRPELFGTQIAMGEGTVVAQAGLDAAGAPPVVVVFSRVGAEWDQVDVLECPGGGGGCACTGEERFGCFGAALSVWGGRLAVGNTLNGSVLIYQQEKGVLAWDLVKVLTSKYPNSATPNMFGASVSLSDSVLVVGSPSSLSSGATVFSMAQSVGLGGHKFGDVVFDTRDHCCALGLPCCGTSLVGVATIAVEYDKEASIVVGDPRNAQAHVIRCNTTALRFPSLGPACTHVVTILPNDERRGGSRGPDGWGGSLAYGGQAILMGDASRHCAFVAEDEGCGTVCEVPSCAPGYCLLYDISLDQDFCQECSDPDRCQGGMRSCMAGDAGALGAMALSTALFFVLFCCLYGMSAWARGGVGPCSLLCELFCCLPMGREGGLWDIGRAGRDRLLSEGGSDEEGGGGAGGGPAAG